MRIFYKTDTDNNPVRTNAIFFHSRGVVAPPERVAEVIRSVRVNFMYQHVYTTSGLEVRSKGGRGEATTYQEIKWIAPCECIE